MKKIIELAAHQSSAANPSVQLHYVDSAAAATKLSVADKMQYYLYKSALYSNEMHDYARANLSLDTLFSLIERHGPRRYQNEFVLANYQKGDIYYNQKLYNEAYSYYYKAKSLGNTTLDSCTSSEYTFRLGIILYRQSRFAEAAVVFRQSLQESQSCSFDFTRFYRRQQVMDNIGLSYYKSGNPDSALLFYNEALNYIRANQDKFPGREDKIDMANAVVYGNMADVQSQFSQVDLAKALLKASIAINSRSGLDNHDAELSQVKLAEIYYNEHHRDSMYNTLTALSVGLDSSDNPRAEMDWNKLMWHYWEEAKNTGEAHQYLVRYTALRDALEKDNNAIKSADLSQQIRILETQYQIQALQRENEVKNIYLWFALIGSLVAVAFAFVIFRNLVRSRNHISVLRSLHNQVNEQRIQLQEAYLKLENKSKQQERILRVVAHDLRAPVATVAMLAELIEQEKDENARKEMIGFVKKSCNNSLDLIAEILQAADESNREEQEKEPVSMNALIKSSTDLLQLKAAEKKQIIETHLPLHDLFLVINPEKIKRVLSNLVTNAIKFSPFGEKIEVSLQADEEFALITVKDNGIGIPDQLRGKIFDMFTEAKRKGTNGELPYGLGLSICKQIVEAHQGTIWVESEGKGSSFFVRLPI